MATFKATLGRRKQDGTYRVNIRVTHNRVSRYIPTSVFVTDKQLTRGLRIKDVYVNDIIDKEISRLRNKCNEHGFVINGMSVDEIIFFLNNDKSKSDFLVFLKNKLQELEKVPGKEGTAKAYWAIYNRLYRYSNGSAPFDILTRKWVVGFQQSMAKTLSANTVNTTIGVLGTYYRMAKNELNDEENGVIIVKYNGFEKIDRIEETPPEPRAFPTMEMMQKFIDAPYSGHRRFDIAKDLFVFSFSVLGINPCDILDLRHEDYKDGIITYRRHKIVRRRKQLSEMCVLVPEHARVIIDRYKGDPYYLFNLPYKRHVNVMTINIHGAFVNAGIENTDEKGNVIKEYVFYSARHSMATFARNKAKIDKYTVNDMLNHTSPEMSMTDVYVRKDFKPLWEANEKLMALFDWSFYLNQKKEA